MKTMQFGDVEVTRVEEMLWEIPHDFLFPQLSEADFAPHMDWLAPRFFSERGRMLLSIQAFVIRTPHHTVVVDTCIGNDKERPIEDFSGLQTDFLERLHRQAGVTPNEVDYVFCTHFHADHVGWNTRLVEGRWEPTFANARYVFHRPEFEHYMGLPDGEKPASVLDSVAPIAEAGKAELVDGGHMIGDHISLEPTPGHTPGHCSVNIATPRDPLVITGDMIHTPAQVREPEWKTRVCHDPEQAVTTRKAFVERHAESGSLVLGTHFPSPTACRFERKGGTYLPSFES
jgi:glyoxylase-like metal-dependent hydrolase (beta-lactamase superfamily II)